MSMLKDKRFSLQISPKGQTLLADYIHDKNNSNILQLPVKDAAKFYRELKGQLPSTPAKTSTSRELINSVDRISTAYQTGRIQQTPSEKKTPLSPRIQIHKVKSDGQIAKNMLIKPGTSSPSMRIKFEKIQFDDYQHENYHNGSIKAESYQNFEEDENQESGIQIDLTGREKPQTARSTLGMGVKIKSPRQAGETAPNGTTTSSSFFPKTPQTPATVQYPFAQTFSNFPTLENFTKSAPTFFKKPKEKKTIEEIKKLDHIKDRKHTFKYFSFTGAEKDQTGGIKNFFGLMSKGGTQGTIYSNEFWSEQFQRQVLKKAFLSKEKEIVKKFSSYGIQLGSKKSRLPQNDPLLTQNPIIKQNKQILQNYNQRNQVKSNCEILSKEKNAFSFNPDDFNFNKAADKLILAEYPLETSKRATRTIKKKDTIKIENNNNPKSLFQIPSEEEEQFDHKEKLEQIFNDINILRKDIHSEYITSFGLQSDNQEKQKKKKEKENEVEKILKLRFQDKKARNQRVQQPQRM